jgi:hypothetical protein
MDKKIKLELKTVELDCLESRVKNAINSVKLFIVIVFINLRMSFMILHEWNSILF